MDEGLTARELYFLLRRSLGLLVAVPVVLAAITFGISQVIAKTFESRASVSLAVSAAQNSSSYVTSQQFANLPSAGALAQSFTEQLDTQVLAKALGTDNPLREYEARYDERKGVLTLIARASTGELARGRAEKFLRVVQEFLEDRLVAAATLNFRAALAQTRVDLAAAESSLRDVQALLKNASRGSAPVSAATAAALEARKVDPQLARASNPALAFLALQEAQMSTNLALSRARAEEIEKLIQDPKTLFQLVGQVLQVQVLVPPAEPVKPLRPRPLVYAFVAAFFGFVSVFLFVLARDAIHSGTRGARSGGS